MSRHALSVVLLALSLSACTSSQAPEPALAAGTIDTTRLMNDLRVLAADSMEGRRVGTVGSERARRFLVNQFERIGLRTFDGDFVDGFTFTGRDSVQRQGVNVVGWVRGTERPGRYIVVSSHYDHVGIGPKVNGDSIYNGADDDASGTAAVLELARWFAANPPRVSMIFVAFDAEESGLRGSRAMVARPPVPLDSILVAVTMDMVSNNPQNELVAAGTNPYPFLRPYVERVVAGTSGLTIRYGHDTPDLPRGDEWLSRTDAGPFHTAKVPALLFSVADHPHYHQPSDEVSTITPEFYKRAVQTVLDVVRALDADASGLAARR